MRAKLPVNLAKMITTDQFRSMCHANYDQSAKGGGGSGGGADKSSKKEADKGLAPPVLVPVIITMNLTLTISLDLSSVRAAASKTTSIAERSTDTNCATHFNTLARKRKPNPSLTLYPMVP